MADAQTLRAVGAGRIDTEQTSMTAIDATVISADSYAHADEGEVIENTRTRVNELVTALQRIGLIA